MSTKQATASDTAGQLKSIFSSFTDFAVSAAKTGTNVAKKGASASRAAVHSAADKVGLKDQVNR